MATSISGSNAISGLSGMDTNFDDTLAKLKKIESIQLNRLTAWKSDWNLRYEAFGSIIQQVQVASNVLSTLGNRNSFVTKNVASSNDNVLTAVANASAQDVQHTINVLQMASNSVWANTGHVFSSKTDVINDSGVDQDFTFTYAGTTKSIKVPPKTTLESFASMVNNSTENPGIKVSLVQTGTGYVFQVAGKSTGAENDLVIHSSGLVGMSSAGSSSVWKSNNALDLGATLSDPKKYAFDLFMEDGSKFSVSITGDKTNQNLADQINTQTGRNVATLDSSGNLALSGVSAMYQRDASASPKSVAASTKVTVGSDPTNTKLQSDLTMTLNYDDGVTTGTRQLTIKAGTNLRDALIQMAQATGMKSADLSMDSSGRWSINLDNITGIAFDSGANPTDVALFASSTTASDLGARIGTLPSATTSINFKASMLSSKLGGNSADGAKNFTYTIVDKSGSTKTITLANNKTYQDLANEIQTETGVAPTTDGSGNLSFSLGNTLQFYVSQGMGGGMDGLTTSTASSTLATGLTPSDTLDATQPDLKYTVTLNDGAQISVGPIASGSTMQQVVDSIQQTLAANSAAQAAGATVKLVKADGTDWTSASDGNPFLSITNAQSVSGPGIKGQVAASSNWNIQRSANARFTVDNWPIEMESASNSVSDVIDGVVFTLQDKGQARISVSTDITSVEKSIQTFLDAVNSVLLTVRDFTKFDKDKKITTNDPDHAKNDNYSPSQLTAEKGGLLQGNYGVQLFKSRFNSLLGSSPPGFKSRSTADDLLSGDVLANLANMGIKVNNNEASDKFGLLEIAPSSSIAALQQMDQENYTNMITNNLESVVDFFCTDGTGTSTSSSFRYGSHVAGITKAGTYDVSYTVDASGNIEKVMVGGVEAKRDLSQAGYYYSVGSGEGRGLAILIDDLSQGEHTGQVRIKEGLTQTVNSFLKNELVYNDVNLSATDANKNADAIALKSQNGALMVLRNNYKTIMDNIDKKITQEQNRLSLWETRQKKSFANLETLLKKYNSQQSQLESQIAKMNSSSKS